VIVCRFIVTCVLTHMSYMDSMLYFGVIFVVYKLLLFIIYISVHDSVCFKRGITNCS